MSYIDVNAGSIQTCGVMTCNVLCPEAVWRHTSERVIQPRVSRIDWQISSAAPVGWATTTSSQPTWAPKRSAVEGETFAFSHAGYVWPVNNLVFSMPCTYFSLTLFFFSYEDNTTSPTPVLQKTFSPSLFIFTNKQRIVKMHFCTYVLIPMYWLSVYREILDFYMK